MLNFKKITVLLCIFSGIQTLNAQFGFSHEVGVIAGPVAFQSDFGERHDFSTNSGNTGIGIGIIHYVNFSIRQDCNCYASDTWFSDHFKLRSELSWNTTKLEHFGQWVASDRTSDAADRLRAHSGKSTNLDLGMQLEYFPRSIRSFQAFSYRLAPFASLGVHYVWYNPEANTTYGDRNVNNPNNFHPFWINAADPNSLEDPFISTKNDGTWSVVWSAGVRYKLNEDSDLMLDLRWQYYFSDWVDGLDHNYKSNKVNDWNVWLNFGYVYYLF